MLLDTMRLVAADVRGGVFVGCGHYVPEEAPRAVAEQIIRFMGKCARPQARRERELRASKVPSRMRSRFKLHSLR